MARQVQAGDMAFSFFYSDLFDIPLPPGHRFPGEKYGMLRELLLAENILVPAQLQPSPLAGPELLRHAHGQSYVDDILEGTISPDAMRRIGLPWSSHLAKRARATVGGQVAAMRAALETGLSGQLAGGTHHAHADFGSGFCVFNDQAVAALAAIHEGLAQRVAIVDLDVHQGDGNAAILGGHPQVMVVSLHGEKNFPFRKVASDLDIGLPDGMEDDVYLSALDGALEQVAAFKPDLVFYQAGVDPLAEDKLGRLSLSYQGLAARDRRVLTYCRASGVPVSMAIGGGYAQPITLSVRAYANTYRVAAEIYGF